VAPSLPATAATAPAAVPLSEQLGVQGTRNFLLQHVLIGARHSYRVMDAQNRHLFSVGENLREERAQFWQSLVSPVAPMAHGLQVNWGGPPPAPSYWVIDDASGNARGALALQVHRGGAVATLSDLAGSPAFVVQVNRGIASITASGAGPGGQGLLEARGNLFHHNFSLHDGAGAEVAKIHEAFVSVRDTYHLDLVGRADPVSALVFAILIDHYKGK
jgi:hypothetical protein